MNAEPEMDRKPHVSTDIPSRNRKALKICQVPNRWMLVEPHYGLAFLSWLPHNLRSSYLRMHRGVQFYDCEPLTKKGAERLLGNAGFEYKNKGVMALRLTLELERPPDAPVRRLFDHVPNWLISALGAINPTLIYCFYRDDRRSTSSVGEQPPWH